LPRTAKTRSDHESETRCHRRRAAGRRHHPVEPCQAPKPDAKTLAATGILDRLAGRSGVYGVPPGAKVPGFIADAGWPQKLPNNWILGQIGGLYVAPDDHIWVYQRPRSLTNDEAALTGATHKAPDGKPVDCDGNPRPYGVLGDCCLPAPSVMEFDANGKLLQAWAARRIRANAA
jgi:hypothetical protein